MNINKANFKSALLNPPYYNFHDFQINQLIINNRTNEILIISQELGKDYITTLIFKNVLYFEYPNFNPWGSSDGIISCIAGEELNNYIDCLTKNRYFNFEKESISLIENINFSEFDGHFLIIIEMMSGDYLKFIVNNIDIDETKVK